MSTIESMNQFQQLPKVRVVAATNQTGTYFNGATNNGVGATFTYATGALTIDGVTINVGDFILFAAQTSAFQNGIYQCTQAGATGVAAILQRRGDFQCQEHIRTGHYVPVGAGTTYAGSMWIVVEPLPAAIGSPASGTANNINFVDVASAAGGPFMPLSGGTFTGSAFANKGTGTVSSGAVTINTQAGVITTTSLSTAGGASTTITLTNSQISSSSVVLLSWMGGTNTTANFTMSVVPGTGTATITIFNNTAATALNGTIIIGFEVL